MANESITIRNIMKSTEFTKDEKQAIIKEKFKKNINFFLTFYSWFHIIILALRKQTYNLIGYALLAQLVEHLTLNQGVQGSSP